MDIVANIVWPDGAPNEALAEEMRCAAEDGLGTLEDGVVWFRDGYLAVHDEDDPQDGPLHVMYAPVDGSGATVFAADCADVGELERRCYRCFSDGWAVDDHGEAVPAGAAV